MAAPISIKVFVPGLPIAQPRQRHTKDGRNYTPTKHPVRVFKTMVAYAVMREYSGELWDGPIKLDLALWFPRPKAKIWAKKPMPREWHTAKPDADNVLKAITDALKNILWKDDSQVCDIHVTKTICAGGTSYDMPGVWMTITQLEERQEHDLTTSTPAGIEPTLRS